MPSYQDLPKDFKICSSDYTSVNIPTFSRNTLTGMNL